ncbi:thioredoxin domain-containing protein [Elongatibacter sediminis]|uniref:Thioredoxin domain-containing protein n=1 Tax=Elongatibacter sediminis TaxID=3119006 RepID=A0AAW9RGS8_9GAMM
MTNRLIQESSPYLQQHADNPVDWYPWCEEALQRARDENRPILLSIGYAACHWCHVMAHESFEDAETAALMNRHFINIKVDREERPDLDGIYMSATTAMTGQGGWPMTVFLTPDGRPFYCGTYYPKEPRYGMPSFRQLLNGVADAWANRREDVDSTAEQVTRHLAQAGETAAAGRIDSADLDLAVEGLKQSFDPKQGGFGGAPKFPQPMVLDFLLREQVRTGSNEALHMARFTLERMADGGIHDHLGGGFARYATDAGWLVPHFEKMLYDNAQLARSYLHLWQVTGEAGFRAVAESTLAYVARDLCHEAGGFYSSEDADSEGEEGRFYVWQADEIRRLLGDDADAFMRLYGVSEEGNWEGSNILHRAGDSSELAAQAGLSPEAFDARMNQCRGILFDAREQRVRPGLDDKVLTAWNGLMLTAYAEAGRFLGRPDLLETAIRNATFLRTHLRRDDGRLWRAWKDGVGPRHNAYLEDYACLCEGLLALYEATFDESWYLWARELAGHIQTHFADPEGAGFYDTSDDHERLIVRPRDLQDNAMPSGNAKAAMVLFRLGLLSGESRWLAMAEAALARVSEIATRHPGGFGEWLKVASFTQGRPRELAVIGDRPDIDAFLAAADELFRPNLVVAAGSPDAAHQVPLLRDRSLVGGQPAAYLCERFTCQTPVTDAGALRELLSAAGT